MASLEKTWAKLAYSDRREVFSLAFTVAIVSSVIVVSLTMTGEFRRNLLQSPQRILLMRWLFRECWRYWSSMSWSR